MAGTLGRKIGMTSIFDEAGHCVPVTLIEAGPSFVLGIKTKNRDGYSGIVLGFGEKKKTRVKKPQERFFAKIKVSPKRFIREIKTGPDAKHAPGDKLEAKLFKPGEFIDVTGTTIGKGFQGGMKRWHWSGGDKSHGSMFHRAPGSIGASSFPSRVFKGQHLPGHMGAGKRTVQNAQIVIVDEEKNLLAVKGAVPGPKGGFLVLRHAKKSHEATTYGGQRPT